MFSNLQVNECKPNNFTLFLDSFFLGAFDFFKQLLFTFFLKLLPKELILFLFDFDLFGLSVRHY